MSFSDVMVCHEDRKKTPTNKPSPQNVESQWLNCSISLCGSLPLFCPWSTCYWPALDTRLWRRQMVDPNLYSLFCVFMPSVFTFLHPGNIQVKLHSLLIICLIITGRSICCYLSKLLTNVILKYKKHRTYYLSDRELTCSFKYLKNPDL